MLLIIIAKIDLILLFLLRIDGLFAIIIFSGYEIVLDENGNAFLK